MSIDKYRQNWRQLQDAKIAVDQHLEGFRTCEKPSMDWKSLVFATGLIICAIATFFLYGMQYAKAENSSRGERNMTTIETSVQGIPCLVQVDSYKQIPGSFGKLGNRSSVLYSDLSSDWDQCGYTGTGYTILDRKGYPAPWLEKKLTNEDDDKIRTDIFNHFSK